MLVIDDVLKENTLRKELNRIKNKLKLNPHNKTLLSYKATLERELEKLLLF